MIHIAKNKRDKRTGLKDNSKDAMYFPNTNNMTMVGMKDPVLYYGLTKGQITDKGVAYPGQRFKVNGENTLEVRLKNNNMNFNKFKKKLQQGGTTDPYEGKDNASIAVLSRMLNDKTPGSEDYITIQNVLSNIGKTSNSLKQDLYMLPQHLREHAMFIWNQDLDNIRSRFESGDMPSSPVTKERLSQALRNASKLNPEGWDYQDQFWQIGDALDSGRMTADEAYNAVPQNLLPQLNNALGGADNNPGAGTQRQLGVAIEMMADNPGGYVPNMEQFNNLYEQLHSSDNSNYDITYDQIYNSLPQENRDILDNLVANQTPEQVQQYKGRLFEYPGIRDDMDKRGDLNMEAINFKYPNSPNELTLSHSEYDPGNAPVPMGNPMQGQLPQNPTGGNDGFRIDDMETTPGDIGAMGQGYVDNGTTTPTTTIGQDTPVATTGYNPNANAGNVTTNNVATPANNSGNTTTGRNPNDGTVTVDADGNVVMTGDNDDLGGGMSGEGTMVNETGTYPAGTEYDRLNQGDNATGNTTTPSRGYSHLGYTDGQWFNFPGSSRLGYRTNLYGMRGLPQDVNNTPYNPQMGDVPLESTRRGMGRLLGRMRPNVSQEAIDRRMAKLEPYQRQMADSRQRIRDARYDRRTARKDKRQAIKNQRLIDKALTQEAKTSAFGQLMQDRKADKIYKNANAAARGRDKMLGRFDRKNKRGDNMRPAMIARQAAKNDMNQRGLQNRVANVDRRSQNRALASELRSNRMNRRNQLNEADKALNQYDSAVNQRERINKRDANRSDNLYWDGGKLKKKYQAGDVLIGRRPGIEESKPFSPGYQLPEYKLDTNLTTDDITYGMTGLRDSNIKMPTEYNQAIVNNLNYYSKGKMPLSGIGAPNSPSTDGTPKTGGTDTFNRKPGSTTNVEGTTGKGKNLSLDRGAYWQLAGKTLPALYNLANSFVSYKRKPSYNKYRYEVYDNMRRRKAPTDYSRQIAAARMGDRNIRNSSPNSQVARANRLAMYNQMQQGLRQNELQNQQVNQQLAAAADQQLNRIGEHELAVDEAVRAENLQHEAARDNFRHTAIGQFGQVGQDYGQFLQHRAEKQLEWDMMSQIYENYGLAAYNAVMNGEVNPDDIITFNGDVAAAKRKKAQEPTTTTSTKQINSPGITGEATTVTTTN